MKSEFKPGNPAMGVITSRCNLYGLSWGSFDITSVQLCNAVATMVGPDTMAYIALTCTLSNL